MYIAESAYGGHGLDAHARYILTTSPHDAGLTFGIRNCFPVISAAISSINCVPDIVINSLRSQFR